MFQRILQIVVLAFILQGFQAQAHGAEPIRDELVEKTLPKHKARVVKYYAPSIKDDLLDKKFYTTVKPCKPSRVVYNDIYVANTLGKKRLDKHGAKLSYDFSNILQNPVQIRPVEIIDTKNNPTEGTFVKFLTTSTAKLPNNVVLPENTEVLGRIETVSLNNTTGVPADIIVGNFSVKNNKKIKFTGRIEKTGANRALWVFPIYAIASNATIFATPLMIFYFIRGGHAKIKPEESYTVYYHP